MASGGELWAIYSYMYVREIQPDDGFTNATGLHLCIYVLLFFIVPVH